MRRGSKLIASGDEAGQSGHWPWIAKHAAASLQVPDTDHGTGCGTRLVPFSSFSINSTEAKVRGG